MLNPVRLVIADVDDGTLLTPTKQLTARASAAVLALRSQGVAFVLTSGRPPPKRSRTTSWRPRPVPDEVAREYYTDDMFRKDA